MWVLVSWTDCHNDYQHHKNSNEEIRIEWLPSGSLAIAEPGLGFSQNPSSIELKSLIMAQIERWRQA